MPPKKRKQQSKAAAAKSRAKRAKQKKIEKGQTALNWSSKGGQKGSSGRARDGPQVVTIFTFCAKQLLEQWGLVVL